MSTTKCTGHSVAMPCVEQPNDISIMDKMSAVGAGVRAGSILREG